MKKIKVKKLFLTMLLVGIFIIMSLFYVHKSVETQEKEVKITLLATSDVHGRFMPWDYAIDEPNLEGSLTQLQTLIKEIRQENPNTILLDAGDMIQDNSAELFNDQSESPMMVAMNEMGYDVWTLGNHEFNFGMDTLTKIADQYTGIKLAGNVYKKNGERFLPASTVIERAGIKIGIIGMVTPMVTEFEKGSSHLDGIEIRSAIKETKKAVADLDGKADVIVGLVHMGLENEYDVAGTGVQGLTKAVPELDAIFAGHAHELIKETESNG
ncbi:metallophosphoesterase, partial [Carnobacterium sp.]|uniref:metallophosphoesterase n=1 Tax=Carnobacterium sp. TaxID=48221 RepID=UPI0028A721C5